MRDRHCPFIIASESVQTRISITNRVSGVKRNEKIKSTAIRITGIQSHLFKPSRYNTNSSDTSTIPDPVSFCMTIINSGRQITNPTLKRSPARLIENELELITRASASAVAILANSTG